MADKKSQENTQTDALSWFIRRGKQVRGPISSAKIRHYILEGRLQLDDEVSQDKKSWRRVGQVDEVVPLQFRHDNSVDEIDRASQSRRNKRRAWVTIMLALVATLALVGFVLWQQDGDEAVVSQCEVKAQPGVNWSNCKFYGRSFAGKDLRGALLKNASMINIDLSEALLAKADLSYAVLSGANLAYADLNQANLKGVNLRGADLTNTDVSRTNLQFADLTAAKVGGLILAGADMQGTIWVDGKTCQDNKCRNRR